MNTLEEYCTIAIDQNSNVVEGYKEGKMPALYFLTGQVMRLSKGTADPNEVEAQLKEMLI